MGGGHIMKIEEGNNWKEDSMENEWLADLGYNVRRSSRMQGS